MVTHLNAGELLITFKTLFSAIEFQKTFGGWLFEDKVLLFFSSNELEYFSEVTNIVVENSNVLKVRCVCDGKTEYYG